MWWGRQAVDARLKSEVANAAGRSETEHEGEV
jgi:hypothetical protein